MKKVLILTIGCQLSPWERMIQTSLDTWDSFEVEGVENVFFCGEPVKENTDKIIYFPVDESYYTMSWKMLMAFEWALENKEFDYILRANSSTYIDKNALIEYIETFESENVFAGVEVDADPKWAVGWSYIISKDVIKKIVENKVLIRNDITDDLALSYLINHLQIPYTKLKICSINKHENDWSLVSYNGGESFNFTDFADCKNTGHAMFRCKQDLRRHLDAHVMKELFKNLY